MRKIKEKSGFTLVECIVAMAVLTIMSLLLMMILTVTVNSRNKNMTMERELDEQVYELVAKDNVVTEAQTQEIVFKQGEDEIEKIPGNGNQGIKANKVYQDDKDSELDALQYDFSGYKKFEEISKGGGTSEDDGDEGNHDKAYGAFNTTVYVNQTSITPTPADDDEDSAVYTVILQVKFSISEGENISEERAVKVALPTGCYKVGYSLVSGSANMLQISQKVIRIEPTSNGDIEAKISFNITKSDFDSHFGSVKEFYESSDVNGTSASVTVKP